MRLHRNAPKGSNGADKVSRIEGKGKSHTLSPRAVLNGKKQKKCSRASFPKKARGHSMCSTVVGGGWRLAAVGGWQLATGGWWRLVVVGGGWWLVIGGWWRLAVVGSWRLVAAGGWQRLVAGGWQRLVVGGWWRLAVDGSWRLAVGGPLGRSLRAVLSKKKKSGPLRTPLLGPATRWRHGARTIAGCARRQCTHTQACVQSAAQCATTLYRIHTAGGARSSCLVAP